MLYFFGIPDADGKLLSIEDMSVLDLSFLDLFPFKKDCHKVICKFGVAQLSEALQETVGNADSTW